MAVRDKQKMISALETLQENGRRLLAGDVTTEYQVWKTEVRTVARRIFGDGTPEYEDIDHGFWRYEEFVPIGIFNPVSDYRKAVENVIDILEGQKRALGYDLNSA
jgi:hypothetical protein